MAEGHQPDTAPEKPQPKTGEVTRRTARNAAVAAAADIAGKVATLAFAIAAARILEDVGFGEFSYALSFSLIAATLISAGFNPQIVQRASADPPSLPYVLSEVIVWRIGLTVPVLIGTMVLAVFIRPSGTSLVALSLVLVASLIDVFSDTARAAAAARQNLTGVSLALVVQRFAAAGLGIAAMVLGFGVVGVAATYFGASLIGLLLVIRSVRGLGVTAGLRYVTRSGLATTGRTSGVLAVDSVISMSLFRVDQVLLGSLQGARAVGIYAAPYRLLETVLFLSWAVSRAVFPVMSAAKTPGRIRRGVEEGIAAVALVYVPFGVGLWFEAGEVIRLLFGEEFAAEGAVIARWLSAAPLVFGINFLANYGLLALAKRWQTVVSSLVAAVFNIALNLILIPRYSGQGAAIATTASDGLEAVIILVVLTRAIGWVRLDRALAVPFIASAVMGAVLWALRINVILEVLIGGLVYAALWFLLARRFRPEHVQVLKSLVPGRRRRDSASQATARVEREAPASSEAATSADET